MSEPSPIPTSVQALLAQQDWVERLARGLVRDSSLAQDLAQEAWLTIAVRGHDAAEEPGALKSFLAGVVRNLGRNARRGERRRERREAAAARPEALPSAAELVERLELQRLLVESVLALDEHERTAVQLRYFEGLSAEEIAHRAGVPAATIRARLARGLERLRGRLEGRVDRRELWAGLVALARLDPATLAGVPDVGTVLPWIGVVTMKSLYTVGAACAALLTLAGVWVIAREPGGERTPARAGAPEEAPLELASASGPAPADLVEPGAERAALATETRAAAAPAPTDTPVRTARVRGRLIDEEGLPVAGARVVRHEKELGASLAGGLFEVVVDDVSGTGTTLFQFLHPRHAERRVFVRLSAGADIQLGDVVLLPAGELVGRVEDEFGRLLDGARVITTGLENERTDPEELRRLGPLEEEGSILGTSDADGHFRLTGVPVGTTRLWAGKEGYAWASFGPLSVHRGEAEGEVRLVLTPLSESDRITGRVLDPEGRPVAARIHTWFTAANIGTGRELACGPDGRFEILLQQRVGHDLTVSDPQNRWAELYVFQVEPGTRDLELVFEPARWIDVHVTDGEGAELEGFELALASHVPEQSLRMATKREEGAPGHARLRIPNAGFRVDVQARGREHDQAGPFEPADAPETLEFDLGALPGIHGRVLTAAGTPAAGARVALARVVSEHVVVLSNGFRSLVDSESEETRADGDGRFVLYPPAPRPERVETASFVVRAEAPGHARTELAPREYDPKQGYEIELTLARGGAIEGRAALAPGVDPTGLVLAYQRGDGVVRSLRLGADGRYRMDGLTPGPWEVRPLDDEPAGNRSGSSARYYEDELAPPMEDWSCTVVEGETVRYDVDLTDRAPCTVIGRLELAGRELAGWSAALERPQEFETPVVTSKPLDAQGAFELVVPRGGSYRLALRGPEDGNGRLELSETLELAPGRNEWTLTLRPGRVEGEGALGRGTRERFHAFEWAGHIAGHELRARVRIVADADGRFVLPCVPEGPGRITRNDPPGEGQEFAPWENVAEFTLAAGGVERVRIP